MLHAIGFIGVGAVGAALAGAVSKAGYKVTALYSQDRNRALTVSTQINSTVYNDLSNVLEHAQVIFLTIPDGAIASVCQSLQWRSEHMAVHCSGLLPSGILSPVEDAGGQIGKFHPLLSIPRLGIGEKIAEDYFAGCTISIEAKAGVLQILTDIVKAIGGTPFYLDPDKSDIYHASAVIASNYLVTLLGSAASLWSDLGLDQAEAVQHLLPLVESVLKNIKAKGIPSSLTGPISRGDIETIQGNLDALARFDSEHYDIGNKTPGIVEMYRTLGLHTIRLALEKGTISFEQAEMIESVLSSYPKNEE